MRTALKDLYDFNVKFIQWLERAGMSEEVPSAELYYAEPENNCSEVLKLVYHRVSVSCALNLSSGRLEDDVNPDDSISKTTRSTKQSSSKTLVQCAVEGPERRSGAQTKTVTFAI